MVIETYAINGIQRRTLTAAEIMNGNFQERERRRDSPHDSKEIRRGGVDQGPVPYSTLDVLCGTNNYNHPGNRRFRSIIDANLQRYVDAPARKDKTRVVCAVLEDIISIGCRFLKQDNKTKKWSELDTQACKTKVGHALRVKSRFFPKSKDVLEAVAAANSCAVQSELFSHVLPPGPIASDPTCLRRPMNEEIVFPNNTNSNNSIPTNLDPSMDETSHVQKKARFSVPAFLDDDAFLVKKPLHPQQHQYQFTTGNAQLMMSNQIKELLGSGSQQNQFYGNLEPSPLPVLATDRYLLPAEEIEGENDEPGLSMPETSSDDASHASSDDSDFLDRINELPLTGLGANPPATPQAEEVRSDDLCQDVRGAELIQLLDFAAAL